MMIDKDLIENTIYKMGMILENHNSICVGVSGGSDSNVIVHMICSNFREHLPKIHFVFQNTGIEYRATLRHLDFIEEKYGIKIDRVMGESVVSVVRKEGVPVLSKIFSHSIYYAERGSQWAIDRVNGLDDGKSSLFKFTPKQKELAKYLLDNNIKVSDKCCTYSKKKPYHKYLKDNKCDLTISGERFAEGGQRAVAHKSCFEEGKNINKYMPLWFWNDETKQYYKETEKIRYSDCYEVWGMKRTGEIK